MARKWFSRSREEDPGDWTGFLEKGVKLEGKLELVGTFRLDAEMKGTLISLHSLILGENARVEGQIEGNHVVVGGRFDGVIFAKDRVEIRTKAIVTGEIHTPCLLIEPGGIFDGRCHMLAAADSSKTLTIPIRGATQG